MNSLKTEFIKYLTKNYLDKINIDISKMLLSFNERGILLRSSIVDLSALDSDSYEFIFKLKVRCEVLKLDGDIKLYAFEVEYSCLLDNGIKELTLMNITDKISKRFSYKESLTDSFIPLNKKNNYEQLAIRFLKYYYDDNFKSYPINVLELVEKVGVNIYISTNIDDSLGKTVFKDCKIKLDKENEPVEIKKGSIILNIRNVLLTGNNKLLRTTIFHECLHWHYHRKSFEIIMLLNEEYNYLDSTDYRQNDDNPIETALSWMEVQAYSITRSSMMLESNIKTYVNNSFQKIQDYSSEYQDIIDSYYSIVYSVSEAFQTTLSDTVKRLIFLGYDEFENLRNEYYGSFFDSVVENKKLKEGQTRRVNSNIYEFMMENSPNIRLAILSGLYVYVDGFIVMNSPKYVTKIGDSFRLSTYARSNIEECSLTLYIKNDYKNLFKSSNPLHFMTVNNGANLKTIYVGDTDYFIIAPFMLPSILNQEEPDRSRILKISYIQEDGLTFSEYFKQLIEKYNYSTVKELMEATHCSRSVIENYRDLDDVGYSVEKVLSICAGMKLLPPESKHLIKKSGIIDLDSKSKRSKIYRHLVENCWSDGIEKWNKILREERIPVLYK